MPAEGSFVLHQQPFSPPNGRLSEFLENTAKRSLISVVIEEFVGDHDPTKDTHLVSQSTA